MFAAQEACGFAGLAERRLFRGHFGYCNFHHFLLVVQRYDRSRPGSFAFTVRRRDGGSQAFWSSSQFAFQRPLHVNRPLKPPDLDASLIELLMDESTPPRWREAVREFNRANTDSTDVPAHVELVMIKSAFELVFSIKPTAESFEGALRELMAGFGSAPDVDGPLRRRWFHERPKSQRLLDAWAREFCAVRGAAAHGGPGASRLVWSEASHLAFAAILFPLVLKKLAADTGRFTMSTLDRKRLSRIEELLLHAPFSVPSDSQDEDHDGEEHPWMEIESDIRMEILAGRMYPDMSQAGPTVAGDLPEHCDGERPEG